MAKVTLPDVLVETYQALADARGISLDQALVLQLTRFQTVALGERVLTLHGPARERLEALLGYGQLASPEDLVAKVERWAGITIGGIRLDFSPGQLEEIAYRADRLGISAEEEVRRVVVRMEELFFQHLGV